MYPSIVGVEKGPHKSQWIRSKGKSETWVLEEKDNLFCFATGQMSRWAILLHFTKGTILFTMSILPLEGCPSLKCQR